MGGKIHRLGFVLGALAGATACAAPQPLPPGPEFSADPFTTGDGGGNRGPNSPKLTKADAGVLPSPVLATDGGSPGVAAHCNSFFNEEHERESNDTVGTANVLRDLACGGINSGSDVDWFVADTQAGIALSFEPDDDAELTVKTPSGKTSSARGLAYYSSRENGRYTLQVRSPGRRTQTYLIFRD